MLGHFNKNGSFMQVITHVITQYEWELVTPMHECHKVTGEVNGDKQELVALPWIFFLFKPVIIRKKSKETDFLKPVVFQKEAGSFRLSHFQLREPLIYIYNIKLIKSRLRNISQHGNSYPNLKTSKLLIGFSKANWSQVMCQTKDQSKIFMDWKKQPPKGMQPWDPVLLNPKEQDGSI